METLKVTVAEPFKVLFDKLKGLNDYIYFVFYGGRGGGKTENISIFLIVSLLTYKEGLKVCCIRKNKEDIEASVYSALTDVIYRYELQDYFLITKKKIQCLINKGFIIFKAIRDHESERIKGLDKFNIIWCEEATEIGARSINVLLPTVLRASNKLMNFVIFSFNPRFSFDAVYNEFVANSKRPKSYVKKVNYTDNPFYYKTNLEIERIYDYNNKSMSFYNNRWLGELESDTEGTLFPINIMQNLRTELLFNRKDYHKIIIGCDPATTDKDYSNEYGIVVYGLHTQTALIVGIDDLSGNMTPYEFANKVNEAYNFYKADAVVVEVNNGGDFIKSTLLNTNLFLNVIEVRANSDKTKRAIPIANLVGQGKIKHIADKMEHVERQMRITTTLGFKGRVGESPDRLDAAIWAIYNLAGIEDAQSSETLFKPDMFKADFNGLYLQAKNATFCLFLGGHACFIKYDYYSYDNKIVVNFKDCLAIQSQIATTKDILDFLSDVSTLSVVENQLSLLFLEFIADKGFFIREVDSLKNLKNKDLSFNLLPFMELGRLNFDENFIHRSFKNDYGNLLKNTLMRYNPNDKKGEENIILRTFLILLYDLFNIEN